MPINIGQIFAQRASLSPDLEAWVGSDYRYTFHAANRRVNRCTAFLAANQVARGDRIAVLAKNNEQVIAMMMAAAKIGAITVLLNWRLQPAELEYILDDCRATVLLYDAEFAPAVEQMRSRIGSRLFLRIGGEGTDVEFDAAITGLAAHEPAIAAGGDDPALLMYTSGTTGRPKGVILTHNNLFWASIGLTHTVNWPTGARFLSVAPLFHVGGLAPIMANIHIGCTSVFLPDFNPVMVWETIEKEKITFLMSVPVMLEYMRRVPDIEGLDLTSISYMICGGSPVPQALIAAYKEMGIKIYQVYGATEYAGAISFWTPAMGEETSCSVGRPVLHSEVKILSVTDERELSAGAIGEIVLLGPQVFPGYWNNEAATEKVLQNGRYRTGDLGKKDADGFLYVIDRLKDMIISGGENIYPAEIETVISTHPGVAEVAVVGRPDRQWGEVPVAVIVSTQGSDVADEEIFALCRENLAGFKCVKEMITVDSLPKNAAGKILKGELKRLIMDG